MTGLGHSVCSFGNEEIMIEVILESVTNPDPLRLGRGRSGLYVGLREGLGLVCELVFTPYTSRRDFLLL